MEISNESIMIFTCRLCHTTIYAEEAPPGWVSVSSYEGTTVWTCECCKPAQQPSEPYRSAWADLNAALAYAGPLLCLDNTERNLGRAEQHAATIAAVRAIEKRYGIGVCAEVD